MRRITMSSRARDKHLHIEVPGGIINIRIGLADIAGRPVTSVSVLADGDRYAGDPEWWVDGEAGNNGADFGLVQTTNPKS
jgi:hypothetical protein